MMLHYKEGQVKRFRDKSLRIHLWCPDMMFMFKLTARSMYNKQY